MDRRTAFVLGVPVEDVTMEETVDEVFALVDRGRRAGRCHQVATVNVDFVVNATRDPQVRAVMQRTALSVPDGMPVVWAARLLGHPLRTRVAGVDLVDALAARAATSGDTLALYGGAPGVADRAAARLTERHPGARVVGLEAPMIREVDALAPSELAPLRAVGADICCVALGNPKQERFIARFGDELGIPVMLGVGGTLDFIVGVQRRAPAWMQRGGLEWLWRAATEPRRLARRYVHDAAVFGPAVAAQAWRGRRSPGRGGVVIARRDEVVVIDLTAVGGADHDDATLIASAVRTAMVDGAAVEVVGAPPGALDRVPGLSELVELAARPTTVRDRARATTPGSASGDRRPT